MTMPAPADLPDVTAGYDDGYFDKDEQGWCARNVAIEQDGARVVVRRWGDDNGLRAYDEQLEGEIVEHLVERGLVVLGGGLTDFVFDLATRRLTLRKYVTRRFVPPGDYDGPAFLARAMQLLLDIAAVLDGTPRVAPAPRPWPTAQASPTFEGAMESRWAIALPDGLVLASMRRTKDRPEDGPQIFVELTGAPWSVQLAIWRPDDGHVLFGGKVALEPAVDVVIDAWRHAGG